jgi:hypothetical protein
MANVTLRHLIDKIRKLTARPSTNQISDASVVDYINLFYQFDLPQALKVFDFHMTYSFITQPNQDVYTLTQADRNNYTSFEPPAYCSGYYINYSQNREQFFRMWPALFTTTSLATATIAIGAGPYTGTLPGIPLLSGSLLLSVVGPAGTTLSATDVGAGALIGTLAGDVVAGGTVNYVTGAISVTWNAVIPAGNVITAKYTPYVASRPLDILYYNNQFVLRPVPDQAYKIELQTYVQPFPANYTVTGEFVIADTAAQPLLNDYFQMLAYGAACKIFVDSLEMDNYKAVYPFLQEQMAYAERKTMMQIKTQRTQTIYSENLYWNSNRLPTV